MSSMSGGRGMQGSMQERIPKGYQKGSMNQFTPEQMQLFQQMFGNVSPDSFTARLAAGDQEAFNQSEAPALRQFGQQQANTASRFSGMGMGGRHSSGFQNTMNQAGSDFAQDLQSRRMSLQQQAIKDLHGMSQDLLGQRPQENFLIEKQKKKSFLEQLLGGVAPLAGAAIGGFAGGPAGAYAGSQAGSAFSQGLFGGY